MTTANALVTSQWRDSWNEVQFAEISPNRPDELFLTTIMKASDVRRLAGVFRRTPDVMHSRSADDNIQRPHESGRSREIRKFVEIGYPMSSMTQGQLEKADASLQRPGWLPTAVVVNILRPAEVREGLLPLSEAHAIHVPDLSNMPPGSVVPIDLPEYTIEQAIDVTPPLEVIDGQHRLWAFEDDEDTEDYYLPVVAFVHLDRAYQAYLFWSINIKPKKINTSLAFDLYPMLRSQDWLMQGEGLRVYRESRAQELTEALWASTLSPWYDRINMIGATGVGDKQPVTQASFVRSLLASFVKQWDSRFIAGGLFGNSDEGGLDWNRAQQAAFLVAAWQELIDAVAVEKPAWYKAIAEKGVATVDVVLGRNSMIASDQGVRAFLLVLNELSYRLQEEKQFGRWQMPVTSDNIDPEQVAEALAELDHTEIRRFVRDYAHSFAQFDWRVARAKGVSATLARSKAIYRGSGGYLALRKDLYEFLAKVGTSDIRIASEEILGEIHDAEERRK